MNSKTTRRRRRRRRRGRTRQANGGWVNRVCWSPRKPSSPGPRDALDGAQRVADDAATAAAAAAAAVDANVDGWGDVEGWEAADDDVEAAENYVGDAEVTGGSSPASATKSHSSGESDVGERRGFGIARGGGGGAVRGTERQPEAAKTIAAEEAVMDAAEPAGAAAEAAAAGGGGEARDAGRENSRRKCDDSRLS